MEKYVAYYRVSTRRQGESGLGLEAQKSAVNNFVKGKGLLIDEFIEIESGRKSQRPELLKALDVCKRNNYTLIISKLDRLSRSLTFISSLMDSCVKFVACDFPEANHLTLSILASLAQYEAIAISTRTKESLRVLKEKGIKLGTPSNLTPEARLKGLKQRINNSLNHPANRQARELINLYRQNGLTFKRIAAKLNEAGYRTRRGCLFFPETVRLLFGKCNLSV
jgi:DNA invertase Pin-like site-specific DNA recombinase